MVALRRSEGGGRTEGSPYPRRSDRLRSVTSPKQQLDDTIEAWRRSDATERLARWRGDPDALPPGTITRALRAVTGSRTRDLYEESVERGLLAGAERDAIRRALWDAALAPARELSERDRQQALTAPVPYDSDHHSGAALLSRITREDRTRERRGMAEALRPTLEQLREAHERHLQRAAEALELAPEPAPEPAPERAAPTEAESVDAAAILSGTEDAWREALERLAHAEGLAVEHWSDLLRALRAPRWDDLVPTRTRPRRLALQLDALGLRRPLAAGARIQRAGLRARPEWLVLRPREDVRISPGVELGLASERSALATFAEAAMALLPHPGLPASLARPGPPGAAAAIGAMLAHLYSRPLFVRHAFPGLSDKERRGVREVATAQGLAELRAAAVAQHTAPQRTQRGFLDLARDQLTDALLVECDPWFAAAVCERTDPARLPGLRLAPPLARAFRDRFDEDFWRNPRAAEPIQYAASLGASLSLGELLASLDVALP